MSDTTAESQGRQDLGEMFGFLVLRLWLSVRAILAGIGKYAGSKSSDVPVTVDGAVNTYGLTASESQKVYSLDNHHGIPEALYGKLQSEPLMPEFALKFFDGFLGPILIVLGTALLLGVFTRISLLLMGLVYVGLTVGLILLKQDAGVAWLGIHVLLVAYALFQVRHNRFVLTRKF